MLMHEQVSVAVRRGDLAAVRSLIEEQGKDVNEKDWVSYLWLRCDQWPDGCVTRAYIRECIRIDTLH